MLVYHKFHKTRKRENAFAHLLANGLGAKIISTPYTIPTSFLCHYVQKTDLLTRLYADRFLPQEAKSSVVKSLRALPYSQIFVARSPKRISFDLVVVDDGTIYYIEFHENQHRSLSIKKRQSKIYDANGRSHNVTRATQRLIRDYWRWTLPGINFRVVWFDAVPPPAVIGARVLKTPECYNRTKFSFTTF